MEFDTINAGQHGPAQVVYRREILLVGEHEIVKPPEGSIPAQRKHGHGRVRGRPRFVVEGQREVFPHHTKLAGSINPLEFFKRRPHARTERALEVAELDEGDWRIRAPPGGILDRHRHRTVITGSDDGESCPCCLPPLHGSRWLFLAVLACARARAADCTAFSRGATPRDATRKAKPKHGQKDRHIHEPQNG